MTIKDYTGLYRTMQDYTGLYRNIKDCTGQYRTDIEIEFELTLLTYKVFSCKDVRSKFLAIRFLAVQSNI